MLATLVNALAIIVGSFLGLLLKKGLSKRLEVAVFSASGIITLVIGMKMAFETTHILAFAIALIVGGLIGTALDVEGAVLRLGEVLKRRFAKDDEDGNFAYGFLSASVLFCSGAMAIVGSFKAGTEQNYDLLFTKSVLDGMMSIIFASAMGIGVMFSALAVFAYQGALTLASVYLKPYVSPLMLAEVSAIGGALVIMIGVSLLDLKKMKTGDFLPSLLVTIALVLLMPFVKFL